ncbi:MAG: alpha/beta fold hydrolase, partial [Actinomycetota bacterium]
MEYLRTPDDRFADLTDFPYEPAYVDVDGLRMAYVDTGPADGAVLLLLHGEPTWSYLYRRMIPPLVDAGFRCVAPDLIGFGRSDKPVDRSVYTYNGHVAWLREFLDAVDLPPATMFAQDWGGLIGLRVAAEHPDRFERLAIGNTGLP